MKMMIVFVFKFNLWKVFSKTDILENINQTVLEFLALVHTLYERESLFCWMKVKLQRYQRGRMKVEKETVKSKSKILSA